MWIIYIYIRMELLRIILIYQTYKALSFTTPHHLSALVGSDVTIPCPFSVDDPPVDPGSLSISWLFNEKQILYFDGSKETSDPRFSVDIDGMSRGQASLTIRKVSIEDEGVFKCFVAYRGSLEEKEARLHVRAPPLLTVTKRTVIMNEESLLRCSASGFHPKNIDFSWSRNGHSFQHYIQHKPQKMSNGTYSVLSEVLIVPIEEYKDQTFSCGVHHVSLKQPIQENFRIIFGASPTFEVHHQNFSIGENQTLVCRVLGFDPPRIVVKWFLNGTHEEIDRVRRLGASEVVSYYNFTPTCQHRGVNISCCVEHDTLPAPSLKNLTVHLADCDTPAPAPVSAPASKSHLTLLAVPAALIIFLVWFMCRTRKKIGFPRVGDISISTILMNGEACLECTIMDYLPDSLTVCWYKMRNGSRELLSEDPGGKYQVKHRKELHEETFECNTSVTFSPTIKDHQGAEFICQVQHPLLEEPIETSTGELEGLGFLVVSEITMPDYDTFRVTVNNCFPNSLRIEWEMVNITTNCSEKLWIHEPDSLNHDGSYEYVSDCKPPSDMILPNQQYVMLATIKHQTLTQPKQVSYPFEHYIS